ncbi:uncharacterized protein LOC133554580 isoform X7 [Nerophis ophidion]|uniref:uncharacterized protein LOC133554580 isoform X7 n=1 Tax=Nerophis ophidion TaxID=159077 RepID=UPI002ADFB730|nr:uncharacterized protein LOC133554580 isoform X7 [Nerophis ophidion]
MFTGTSLNDHLLTGPDLTNTLVGVLCRFRKGPIAFMCDVERMFHQFHVVKEHQDYLRFLWWDKDFQHLIGHQGKLSPRLQGFATLKQENIHFVHVKEEEKELDIAQEGDYLFRPQEADPTKLPMTFVTAKTENHEDLPRENLLASLSPTDSKPFECSKKKTGEV